MVNINIKDYIYIFFFKKLIRSFSLKSIVFQITKISILILIMHFKY